MNCNAEFLKIGPCSIDYKGEHVGITLDSPLLNIEAGLYEAKRTQIGGKAVRKIITNMKITISADVKEINSSFANFFDSNGKITNVVFGKDVLTTGGDLCLSPVSGDERVYYRFSKAVLIPETVYAYKNTKDYYFKMNFEVYEDSEGILIQKTSK